MNLRKMLATLMVALVAVAALAIPAFAAPEGTQGWYKDPDGWHYYKEDGTQFSNGWVNYGEKYYYFDASGNLVQNSLVKYLDNYYFIGNDYTPIRSQWRRIGSDYYYFGANAQAYRNAWLSYNGAWYYFGTDCKLVLNSWLEITGGRYRIGADGKRVESSWFTVGGKYYYAGSDGKVYYDKWLNYAGLWYYLDTGGNPIVNQWFETGGHWYFFGSRGYVLVSDTTLVTTQYSANITDSYGNKVSYSIPKLNLTSTDAKVINDQLNDLVNEAKQAVADIDKYGPDATYPPLIGYTYSIEGDILSLIVYEQAPWNDITNYYIYNINWKTFKKLSTEQVLSAAGLSHSTYSTTMKALMYNKFTSLYGTKPTAGMDSDAFYNQMKKTYADANVAETVPFFYDGSLYAMGKVYSLAGPDYYEYLFFVQ